MNNKITVSDPIALKKLFQTEKNQNTPYIYFPIDSNHGLDIPDKIAKLISGYKRSGFGGVIPFSNKKFGITPLTDVYYDVYANVKKEALQNSMKLAYLDDTYIMREYIAKNNSASCKILTNYEYNCTESQTLKRKLHTTGVLMSIVAINDDDQTIIDLRNHISDGILEWNVPDGNWNIEEYVCEYDYESNYIDLMNYDISSEYLKKTFGALLEKLSSKTDTKPVSMFIYRNLVFAGKNRRMWSENFNKVFEEEYGFDPAPYYPILFRDFFGTANRYKCMFMACRSKMMIDGYLKAAASYCAAREIFCTGFPAESKATACSWLFGDGQMIHKYASAPGISMPFAYLYGLNGIKVAAGAADAFGDDTVSADMFNYFMILTRDIIYREAMNAFVRGVNMVFAHLGADRTRENTDIVENESPAWGSIFSKGDDLAEFAEFAARAQTLLRGGEHICEAAIVYPIHSLHSLVYLYQSENTGFEYPSTPENADYMELMNSILNYVGIDTVFLHPDVIAERVFSENGTLYMNNDLSIMKFKLVILPSMSIVSLKMLRVIKKFFDDGGKIIATDNVPSFACECQTIYDDVNRALKSESSEDAEVREIINHIFGEAVTDKKIYKRIYKNENENGGIAYFLPSNTTSGDRTDAVSADILYQAIDKLGIASDVYIDNMPRREFRGLLNYHLPAFVKVGLDKRLVKGCSMNYIHKRFAECDIFFVTNTTGDKYTGKILLRGRHNPEEWNPFNGKTRKLQSEIVRFRGNVYTAVDMFIDSSSCVFIVSPLQRTAKEVIYDISDDQDIPEFFPRVKF